VVLRSDPRRFAFYLWPNSHGTFYFSPFEFNDFGTGPFSASAENPLRITEDSHPGLPRLEWRCTPPFFDPIKLYLIEVLDTAV
jgi:hypothetical protein